MESVQTSLFQRFGTDSELRARHGIGKLVPVKSNVNRDQWRGSRDLGLQTFRPWPGSLHPHRRFKAFRHRQQAVGQGPPGRCLDRPTATLSPSPRNHRLCRIAPPSPPPTTVAGSLRPSGLPRILVHRLGRAPSEPPKPRQGQRPAPCSPWPVRHRDSGGDRPHTWHWSRSRCGRIPLCRHGERFPSRRSPATATEKPSPRPAGLPSFVLADSPDSPIWPSIQGQF